MSPRVYTAWVGPPRALRQPEGPAAEVDVRCHVRGCGAPAAWWRPVAVGACGACLCDDHRDAMLVRWSMPPYPPDVVIAEQMAMGSEA